ncbi:MAG: hypothetical protein ACKOU6_21120 [Planctomycetota bacterium]
MSGVVANWFGVIHLLSPRSPAPAIVAAATPPPTHAEAKTESSLGTGPGILSPTTLGGQKNSWKNPGFLWVHVEQRLSVAVATGFLEAWRRCSKRSDARPTVAV